MIHVCFSNAVVPTRVYSNATLSNPKARDY